MQPSECEPGLAGAGVQRQRREEQARARQERRGRDGGVVRGHGRGPRERARARQCWGHWEWAKGAARGLTSKATKGDREKAGGWRENQRTGLGALSTPPVQMGRLRPEKQRALCKVTQPGQVPPYGYHEAQMLTGSKAHLHARLGGGE